MTASPTLPAPAPASATTTLMTLLPQGDLAKGGTRVGWSFLKSFSDCEMQWFNTYIRPHRRVPGAFGHAFVERSGPRSNGTLVHHGLQNWYLSDCDLDAQGRCRKDHDPTVEPNYSLDQAIGVIAPFVAENYPHWDSEEAAKAIGDAQALLERHHAYCGPGGTIPEGRIWRVAHDGDNVPFVERTFEIPLGYKDFVFTSKADVVFTGHGSLYPCDHKTHDASKVPAKLRQYHLDGQITGQVWVLRMLWDSIPDSGGLLKPRDQWITGEGGLVSIIVKRAAASKPPRLLEIMPRSTTDMETFRSSAVRKLKRMNERIEEWQGHVSAGMDPDAAALITFDSYPDGEKCGQWPCDYFEGCKTRELLGEWLEWQTEPRWVPETAAKP
jgi:hypothetical protein